MGLYASQTHLFNILNSAPQPPAQQPRSYMIATACILVMPSLRSTATHPNRIRATLLLPQMTCQRMLQTTLHQADSPGSARRYLQQASLRMQRLGT